MNKDTLAQTIKQSESILEALKSIGYSGIENNLAELEELISDFKDGGQSLLESNNTLQIGIVGQVKAGKSTFLNSLFFNGENVLPKASTPMTAGLTVIEYSPKNTFEVEYFTAKDWDYFAKLNESYKKAENRIRTENPQADEIFIRKEIEDNTTEGIRSAHEMVESCSINARKKIGSKNDINEFVDIIDLQNVLEQYVGANGEYTSVVKSLYIKIDDKRLEGVRIVDTPGVNDPIESRENRTKTFLNSCHGVFLLSASSSFLDSTDISFLNNRISGTGIGEVVLLASKFDSVLQDVGAQHYINQEEQDDLKDAYDREIRKFKRRLREQSNAIDEKLRNRIQFDATAGIGYSIAKKSSERWDSGERTIVENMKRFYPNYFDTESDIKETFESLANITDIRTKYLEDLFITNKDKIIAQRVNDYFTKNKQKIYITTESLVLTYKNRQNQLNETSVGEIQRQKQIQGELFVRLDSRFREIFNSFSQNLQNSIKTISNSIGFTSIGTIPTESITGSFEHERKLFGHKYSSVTYSRVNTYSLQGQIKNSIDEYCKSWNDKWVELFKNVRDDLSEKLIKSISEFETEIMSKSFNDKYYRDLIDTILDKLKSNSELRIRDTIDKCQRQGMKIAANQFEPASDCTYNFKEVEIEGLLNRKLNEHLSGLRNNLFQLEDMVKSEIKNEVNQNLNDAIAIIDEIKPDFASKLKDEGEMYLAKLEAELKEKTDVLNQIKSIVGYLIDLQNLYQ